MAEPVNLTFRRATVVYPAADAPFVRIDCVLLENLLQSPEEARDYLLPVVKRQQRAGWAWSLLGRAFEDADKAMACYLRALQLAGQPSEVLNMRVRLAHLLATAGQFPDAARQVRTALQVHEKAGWRMPEDLVRLTRADWYRSLAKVKDLPPEPDVAEAAEVILFGGEGGEIETRLGIIDNQNPDRSLAHVAFSPNEGAVLHYKRFKLAAELSVGTFLCCHTTWRTNLHPTSVLWSGELTPYFIPRG